MSDLIPIRRALVSVSDKTGLEALGRALTELKVQIISTGGTTAALAKAGIAVTPIEKITGLPEMMDGRVKTLHPKVHGALLARRDLPEHVQAMHKHGIEGIDLLCVNLYPFEKTVAREGVSHEEAIEQIDIGGPAMIRSAAKNHPFVAVVTDPSQYEKVLEHLRANQGTMTLELRRELAAAAFARTADYDAAIATWMAADREERFPQTLRLRLERRMALRYGENPHQGGALYVESGGAPGIPGARILHGKELSYNNLNDAAAALAVVEDLAAGFPDQAAAVVVKHANPCGAAIADDLRQAFAAAYEGDPLAAYGGVLAMSRPTNAAVAATIAEGQRFFEVIIAPGFDEDALGTLKQRWKNVRLLQTATDAGRAASSSPARSLRSIAGGVLVQQPDDAIGLPAEWKHAAGPEPSEGVRRDGLLAWIIAKHLSSNAIAIAAGGRLLGGGCGCVDRLTACRIAIEKACERVKQAEAPVAASDAFFPFADGPQLLIDAGVKCLIHPGGSIRDQETLSLCSGRGVTCLLTGVRHFRH